MMAYYLSFTQSKLFNFVGILNPFSDETHIDPDNVH